MTSFFPRDTTHYKRGGGGGGGGGGERTREKNEAIRMKGRKNESKGSVRGVKALFHGMGGVEKQTSSTVCSIKRGFIRRAVDGRGIWIS